MTQYDFVPLGLESMGYCSENCKDLAYYLIGQRAYQKGVPFPEAASEFWYTLSFLIHRQVARNTINRYRRVAHQHEEEGNDEEEVLIPLSVPIYFKPLPGPFVQRACWIYHNNNNNNNIS